MLVCIAVIEKLLPSSGYISYCTWKITGDKSVPIKRLNLSVSSHIDCESKNVKVRNSVGNCCHTNSVWSQNTAPSVLVTSRVVMATSLTRSYWSGSDVVQSMPLSKSYLFAKEEHHRQVTLLNPAQFVYTYNCKCIFDASTIFRTPWLLWVWITTVHGNVQLLRTFIGQSSKFLFDVHEQTQQQDSPSVGLEMFTVHCIWV